MRTGVLLIAIVGTAASLAFGQSLGPLTLTPTILSCTDTPTTATAPVTDLRVVGMHTGDRKRVAAGIGDLVVLNGGTPQGLVNGQQYFARRVMKPTNHAPVTAENPGSVATTGWLTVVAADTRFALARVAHSCVAVEAGDYLEPYVEPALPAAVAGAGPADFSNLGRVLQGAFRRSSFGTGDLLSIDRGQSKSVAAGARVVFYRDRRNGTPLFELGEGIVVTVAAETAMVVLERASMEIRSGDYYALRTKP